MVKVIPILVSTLSLLVGAAILGGCGQKGALVLPPKPGHATATVPPQAAATSPVTSSPAPALPAATAPR